jgi:hypothetical protein
MNAGGPTPTPERLAAYTDGELHGPDRSAIEAWLDVCPQARSEVEALHVLACQCRGTTAPEPSPDAWDAVLNHLHAALPAGPRPLPFPRRGRRQFVPALGAAAAIFAAVVLGRVLWTNPPVPSNSTSPSSTLTGPLELADARDVEIISIGGDDTESLLVGRPPVHEALVLAGPDDVTLVGIDAFQGPVPDWHRDGGTPMIGPSIAGEAP